MVLGHGLQLQDVFHLLRSLVMTIHWCINDEHTRMQRPSQYKAGMHGLKVSSAFSRLSWIGTWLWWHQQDEEICISSSTGVHESISESVHVHSNIPKIRLCNWDWKQLVSNTNVQVICIALIYQENHKYGQKKWYIFWIHNIVFSIVSTQQKHKAFCHASICNENNSFCL